MKVFPPLSRCWAPRRFGTTPQKVSVPRRFLPALWLLLFVSTGTFPCLAQGDPSSARATYDYASDQRKLEETRAKISGLRKDLLYSKAFADTLDGLQQAIEMARYPEIIATLKSEANTTNLSSKLESAREAFIEAFPRIALWERSGTAEWRYHQDRMERLGRAFQSQMPPVPEVPTPEAFDKLSITNFRLIKKNLSAEIATEIAAARQKSELLDGQIGQGQGDFNEQSGKFWRNLQGRDAADKNYLGIGISGLSFMAAIALIGTWILFWLGKNARLPEQFTEYLRWNPLLDITTVFLLTIAIVILGLNRQLNSEVLGTLIGGISGYVLGRNSRASSAAQAQEIREIVRNAPPTSEISDTVRQAMEDLQEKYSLPDELRKMADDQIKLARMEAHMETAKFDRVVIFLPAAESRGAARGVLHLSLIKAFLANKAKSLTPPQLLDLTLDDLLKDAECKVIFDNSAAWVRPTDKLSDAKTAMDSKSRTLGSKGKCNDVLVSESGLSNEHVLGIITNDTLQRRARV